MTMNDQTDYDSLIAHLQDLQEHSQLWHATVCSEFLNEEEQAAATKAIRGISFEGGYPGARFKKAVFRYNDQPDDIVCLRAKTDQRFRSIGHRDVMGALMHLQIERNSFGDFWIEDGFIYLYTSLRMAEFLIANLIRINQLNVSFEKIDFRPVQHFRFREFEAVVASARLDAIVAGICCCSRNDAKQMIRASLVQVNHQMCDQPDRACNEGATISIRGKGRFIYAGVVRKTKSDRLIGSFRQFI